MLRSTQAVAARAHALAHGTVFGFVGAQDRHLVKYAAALHGLGVPLVLRRTAPTFDCFFDRARLRPLAEAWLLTLEREQPHAPGVVWLLSNGGAFVYAHALRLLREDALLPRAQQRFARVDLAAVVYDSAPAHVTPATAANALTAALALRSPPAAAAVRAALRAFFSVTMGLQRGDTNEGFFESLARGAPARHAPPATLFAYSADDEISDAGRIEALAARVPGARAWRVPSPSPHCMHLVTARAEYEARLRELFAAAAPLSAP